MEKTILVTLQVKNETISHSRLKNGVGLMVYESFVLHKSFFAAILSITVNVTDKNDSNSTNYREVIPLSPKPTRSGGRQNLKEVPQNFTKVFNVDDVKANDVIRRNLSSIVITDVKLAAYLKKDSGFCFSFLWQEHYHSKIPGAWLCVYESKLLQYTC